MRAPTTRLVYVTCPDMNLATQLADTVVSERLAACANLLPGMQSIYRWKGVIEHGQEVVVIFKTTTARAHQLRERIRALHPYEIPCIVELPIIGGHAPFLAWVANEAADETAAPAKPAKRAKARKIST